MYGPDNNSAVAQRPAPAAPGPMGWFSPGNPATGTLPTLFEADFANGLLAEVLSVLAQAGIAPSKTAVNQLLQAIQVIAAQVGDGRYLPTSTDHVTHPELTAAVNAAVASVVNGSPAALDTLKELADALNDDPAIATHLINSIALKANQTALDATNNVVGGKVNRTGDGMMGYLGLVAPPQGDVGATAVSSAWVRGLGPAFVSNVGHPTGTVNLTAADMGKSHVAFGGAPTTFVLPDAGTVIAGQCVALMGTAATAITVQAPPSSYIEGTAGGLIALSPSGSILLECYGGNSNAGWFVVARQDYNSPSFNAPTVSAPPAYDRSLRVATTACTANGGADAGLNGWSTPQNFTAAQVCGGGNIIFAAGSYGLPPSSSVPAGTKAPFCATSGGATIVRQGGDLISNPEGGGYVAYSIAPGGSVVFESNGASIWFVVQEGNLYAPSFRNFATGQTAGRNDASATLATTAQVRSVGKRYGARLQLGAAATLDESYVGCQLTLTGGMSYRVVLPDIASVRAGDTVTIDNFDLAATKTVAPRPGQYLYEAGVSLSSFLIPPGASVELYFDGGPAWIVTFNSRSRMRLVQGPVVANGSAYVDFLWTAGQYKHVYLYHYGATNAAVRMRNAAGTWSTGVENAAPGESGTHEYLHADLDRGIVLTTSGTLTSSDCQFMISDGGGYEQPIGTRHDGGLSGLRVDGGGGTVSGTFLFYAE